MGNGDQRRTLLGRRTIIVGPNDVALLPPPFLLGFIQFFCISLLVE